MRTQIKTSRPPASTSGRHSVLVLYSDKIDPICHCARLVLQEKDIAVDLHYAEDADIPTDFEDLNPDSALPLLVDRDLVLYEINIIMEYLDERYPHPPLLPVEPVGRAHNRQWRYRVMRELYEAAADLSEENDLRVAAAKKRLRDQLTYIAPLFSKMEFFMSTEFSLVDCCMAPLLWRLKEYGIRLPSSAKAVRSYAHRLFERSAFQESLSPIEKEYSHI
ncbi:MAG: glutathione S-transferase N-terminal domain-containing protein [Candidatus Eutrophobiaceae bacterium]